MGTVRWQWLRDGQAIEGAVGERYTLTQADVGKAITVRASYVDGSGTAESVTSAATAAVANVNDAPTGDVTISGTATQGHTLTASDALTDLDGKGAVRWQWLRDGQVITGATGERYTLTQDDVGKSISVTVSYVDGQGSAESRTSTATAAVANVNDAPTGGVTIGGTPTQGHTLTASNTLADADGMGTVSYQWLRDGQAIPGATGGSYTLTEADVGKAISVRASYVDKQGSAESRTSTATAAVANVNDAPTGGVTITGTLAIGQVVHAHSTVADADGMGPATYRWLSSSDGVTWTVIEGATGESLTIGGALASRLLRVELIYTDGHGTREVVSSTASGRVPVLPPPVQPPTPPVVPPVLVPPSLTPPPAPAPRDTGPSFLPPGSSLGNPNVPTLTRGDTSVTASNGNAGANQQQQGNQPVLTDGATPRLTQTGDNSSFRVVVLPSAVAAGAEGLVLNRGVADQIVAPTNGTAQITIPSDAFAHTNPNAVVTLNARQANGEALPPWVSFDAATGKFTVRAAPGERRVIEVRVEARDGSNRAVFTTFKIQVGGAAKRASLLEPAGRPGLSTQLRMAAERQQVPLERLDQLARLAKRPAAALMKS
jgi:hypothetical protein